MVFQPGNKLAVGGRKDKHWRDALMLAVSENDRAVLRSIAEKVVELAMDGDMAAIKEIGDRLDGKPAQQQIHVGDKDNPVGLAVQWLNPPAS